MSEEELKKLKEELKREILNEMTRKELVKCLENSKTRLYKNVLFKRIYRY